MVREPSDIDKRAARGFQELANMSTFFPVSCRFRRKVKSDRGFWPEGAEEFKKHFGYASNYFAGALEYVRLATGWLYPYRSLDATILKGKRQTSSGAATVGLHGFKSGDIHLVWANGEFTWTVLHELVHLYKKGWEEDRVEQQALRLTLGV
ncbi:unnamed protein product [marine sediment metagenome]|uniref:Uncharacterized protein n=1 Tax=marine sediment metagenome TaxID=412755 RepID=X1SMV7_9ZZZZ